MPQCSGIVYNAAAISRILGIPVECSDEVPQVADGEIVVCYGGWDLKQLRTSAAGKKRTWQAHDWYEKYAWKAEPGYYQLLLPVPHSNRQSWSEQLRHLATIDTSWQAAPVCVAATALPVLRALFTLASRTVAPRPSLRYPPFPCSAGDRGLSSGLFHTTGKRRRTTMKTITCWNDLIPFGIDPLTGEACGLMYRILCDVTDKGRRVIRKCFGFPDLSLSAPWNRGPEKEPHTGSLMLAPEMLVPLGIFALLEAGCTEVWLFKNGTLAGVEPAASPDYVAAWKQAHAGGLSRRFAYQGTADDRNVHMMSGRIE